MGGREPTAGTGSPFGKEQPDFMQNDIGNYDVGRIIVRGKAYFRPDIVRDYLYNTLKNYWPKNTNVKFLVTPGAFLYRDIERKWGKTNEKWDSSVDAIKEFVEEGEKSVNDLLTNKLYNVAKNKIDYLSIGSDIRFSDGYRAELVYLVDIKKKKIINRTGKSYPTGYSEAKELVQVTDLKTHFVEKCGHKVLILGCHDLNMFSPRSKANLKEGSDRWRRCTAMRELAEEFQPSIVIQHPHTTDSSNIWSTAWSGMKDFESVELWASGISYFNRGDELRQSLEKVLIGTTSDSSAVFDIQLLKE